MRSFAHHVRRFRGDEDGSMVIFSLFVFLLMVMVGGIAVDTMRAEMRRTELQSTIDRAILAAADLDQTRPPAEVVNDYFEKAGMSAYLGNVTVTQGLNFKTVTATGSYPLDTFFMRMSGVDTINVPGRGTAEERVTDVEISLVLDISGSMGWNNKIANLRTAARDFVDTVVKDSDDGLTTISIVPYNATVNLGSVLSQYYTLSDEHDYSRCAIFPDAAFFDTTISRTDELERLGHFDLNSQDQDSTEIPNPWCPDTDYGSILVHSHNTSTLKSHINGLGASGNTAIDLGMKWGVALLDPSASTLITDMIADGRVSGEAASRPAAYTNIDTLKVVVLMTDGENTTQFDLRDSRKSGYSNIFVDRRGDSDPSNDRFSVRIRDNSGTANDVYYLPRYEGWSWSWRYQNEPDGGLSNVERMTFPEVFARWGTAAYALEFYRRPYLDGWVSYNTYYWEWYSWGSIVGPDDADDRLEDICSEARNAGITIFTIGFEAPQRGLAAMSDCASSPNHYFDVEGTEISEAFSAIASQINQLRLTQ